MFCGIPNYGSRYDSDSCQNVGTLFLLFDCRIQLWCDGFCPVMCSVLLCLAVCLLVAALFRLEMKRKWMGVGEGEGVLRGVEGEETGWNVLFE